MDSNDDVKENDGLDDDGDGMKIQRTEKRMEYMLQPCVKLFLITPAKTSLNILNNIPSQLEQYKKYHC